MPGARSSAGSGRLAQGETSIPLCRRSPAFAALGDAQELSDGRGLLLRLRAQAEVVQDLELVTGNLRHFQRVPRLKINPVLAEVRAGGS
jgi:hypothetical protein